MKLPLFILTAWFSSGSLLVALAWWMTRVIQPRYPEWWTQVVVSEITDHEI